MDWFQVELEIIPDLYPRVTYPLLIPGALAARVRVAVTGNHRARLWVARFFSRAIMVGAVHKKVEFYIFLCFYLYNLFSIPGGYHEKHSRRSG
jgi:hypothetical protein